MIKDVFGTVIKSIGLGNTGTAIDAFTEELIDQLADDYLPILIKEFLTTPIIDLIESNNKEEEE